MGDENTRTISVDVDKLNEDQLTEIMNTPDEEIIDKFSNPETAKKFSIEETTKPNPASTRLEMDFGDGKGVMKFKDIDELKSYTVSLRKGFDDVNAKYGKQNQEFLRIRNASDELSKAQQTIEELKRKTAQAPAGQPAPAVTPAIQKVADDLGIDLDDLTPENFKDKMVEIRDKAALKAQRDLEAIYEPKFKAVEEANRRLEEKFGKIESGLSQKEAEIVFGGHLSNLLSEIKTLQDAKVTNGLIKTQLPVEQINETITRYGADYAKTVLPPGDFAKWEIIEKMLRETYCPVDAGGNIDITQRKLPKITSAWAAFSDIYPQELQGNDIANANKQGQKNVLDALTRVTNKPPTLPNKVAANTADIGVMTFETAQSLINTPVDTLIKWQKTDPEKYKLYEQAQEFVNTLE
jgi:hypothetical protein